MFIVLSTAFALPPETELPPAKPSQVLEVAGHRWSLAEGRLTRDGVLFTADVLGEVLPAADRLLIRRLHRAPVHNELWLVEPDGSVTNLADDADRLTVDPKGETLAFVADHNGWASVFIADLKQGAVRQLTNSAVVRQKGAPPIGFTPVPLDRFHFEGCELQWTTPSSTEKVRWCL